MSPVHIHLLLNHVVILGTIFSLLVLAVGYLLPERVLVRTAMIGFVISALVAIPVFLTGEPAEEAIEDLPGITQELIESHEESAEFSIWMIEILGLISLVSLFAPAKFQNSLRILLVVFAIIASGTLINTGLEGGKIRHSELRGATNSPAGDSQNLEEEDKNH